MGEQGYVPAICALSRPWPASYGEVAAAPESFPSVVGGSKMARCRWRFLPDMALAPAARISANVSATADGGGRGSVVLRAALSPRHLHARGWPAAAVTWRRERSSLLWIPVSAADREPGRAPGWRLLRKTRPWLESAQPTGPPVLSPSSI